MRDKQDCKYLNDIKNCEVVTVSECGEFIEIEYIKDDTHRFLTIEFYTYGGSMGYGSFFKYSGVELPSSIFDGARIYYKKKSAKLTDIDKIIGISSYCNDSCGFGCAEQLDIKYIDKNGNNQSFLLDTCWREDEMIDYPNKIEKNKKPTYENKISCDEIQMPKEFFSTKIYKEVLAFALKAHGNQMTPSNLPYAFHIVSVATEIINAIAVNKISYDEANVAIACALLHDVLEDTDTTIGTNSIDIPNIKNILQGVNALTKDTSLPTKKEQMEDSLQRLKEQPKCVQMVKLADRIVNLAPPPIWWNNNKRKAYKEEAKKILDALKGSHCYLENKLQQKIDNYDEYCNSPEYLAFPIKKENESNLKYLVLDKNHSDYTTVFKAIDKLYKHIATTYQKEMFWKNKDDLVPHFNIEKEKVDQLEEVVSIEYIKGFLETQNIKDKICDELLAQVLSVKESALKQSKTVKDI